MDVGATGTSTVCGVTATWEIIGVLPGDSVLVRYTHAKFPDAVWYSRDVREGDGLRSLCRCEHLRADHAQHCRDAERRLADVEMERACARSAKLPTPAGAFYLVHCGGYWKANIGGACPTCGALGDVLTPDVEVRSSTDGSVTVHTTLVHAYHALSDAGLSRDTARAIDDMTGHVYRSTGLDARAMGERLAACGWRVKGRSFVALKGAKVVKTRRGSVVLPQPTAANTDAAQFELPGAS